MFWECNGKISSLYVGVKNERKALSNKKLVEFFQYHNFENEQFKSVIGVILVIALRSGYEHAGILSVNFIRSMLFKVIKWINSNNLFDLIENAIS